MTAEKVTIDGISKYRATLPKRFAGDPHEVPVWPVNPDHKGKLIETHVHMEAIKRQPGFDVYPLLGD